MAARLFDLAGLDRPVPDFNTRLRRHKAPTVDIPYRPSIGALHHLIDSTGMKAEGEGAWFAKKPGPSKPRDWRKVHLGIDAETPEIRAIKVTGNRIWNAAISPDLPERQTMERTDGRGGRTQRCPLPLPTPSGWSEPRHGWRCG